MDYCDIEWFALETNRDYSVVFEIASKYCISDSFVDHGGCDGHPIARPRGATPCLRSEAEARRTPCPKGSGQKELPHVRGQGQQPRVPDCDGAGTAERSYPASEVGGAAERRYPVSKVRGGDERSYPMSEVRGDGREEIPHAPSLRPGAVAGRSNHTTEARGGGWEDQPHVQGAMAAWAQEGLEELSHVEGQEGRW